MFKRKNEKPLIEFVSIVDGIELIEECRPVPAKNFIPSWWLNIPSSGHTIKKCPSFPDFFSQGFIMPMWMDSTLTLNEEDKTWTANSSVDLPTWEAHYNDQFLDFTKQSFIGKEGKFVFKALSPWRIITPPGYSVMQLPLFYHFNGDYSILPGIIDTDILHEANQQIVFHSDKKEIKIKRGDPFALYIPFKRTKYNLNVRKQNKKDKDKFAYSRLFIETKERGTAAYRLLQRQRDNGKL